MTETPLSGSDAVSREEILAAMFAQMVLQQANMAMMLMGKVPHPQTGERVVDLEGAQMLIDQLEMLEAKTKGNLGKEEQNLLKQSLMSVRMAFVEAVRSPAAPPPETPPAQPAAPSAEDKGVHPPEAPSASEAES